MKTGGFIPSVDHQTPPGVSPYEYLPNASKIRAAVANAFKVDPQLEDTRSALAQENATIWVLNGSNQQGQASNLAAYLDYYGLTTSAPNQKPDKNGLSGTRVVVYNGAETRLTETIAFLESTLKTKVQLKTDPAVTADIVITTSGATPNLTPPPSS